MIITNDMSVDTTGESPYSCEHCGASVAKDDLFCPGCGSLFADGFFCSRHASAGAGGVCVICRKPFCKECGKETNGIFLCDPHWHYEILEGMARVFGTTDNLQAHYVCSMLEEAGYHPFLYSRMFNPNADLVAPGGMVRLYGNHPLAELKVLLPFAEVLKAEQTLRELDIKEN